MQWGEWENWGGGGDVGWMIALAVVSHTAEVMKMSEGGGKCVRNENGELSA